jgi:hypothetical protein
VETKGYQLVYSHGANYFHWITVKYSRPGMLELYKFILPLDARGSAVETKDCRLLTLLGKLTEFSDTLNSIALSLLFLRALFRNARMWSRQIQSVG